jgi:cell division protein FtsW
VNRGDRWLIVLPLVLTAVGVVMVYSSSAILGITRFQDPNHFLFKQVARAAFGVLVLVGCTCVPLRRLEAIAPWLFGLAVVLLGATCVLGVVSHGAARWLPVGKHSFQTTDYARLATVVFLARWLKRRPPPELGFIRGVLPAVGIAGGMSLLVLAQPNLSSAALLGMTGILMALLAGARFRHLAIPLAAGAVVVALALATHPYQMTRVDTYFGILFGAPIDPHGSGWQLDQSLIAIGSGGWLGRGLGGGLQKYLFLPEAHTDFIFSILAEELGFLGSTALIVLVTLLLWRGMRAATRAPDPFTHLLAGGLTLQIGLYAIVNLAVATGLAPTTGLPFPFVSYGGTALLANLAAAGLLYRVSAVNGLAEDLARRRWSREAA